MDDIITLDYGSGGQKTSELIDSILLPALHNPALSVLGDGAILDGREKLVFSTDSFVVSPWRFPGGDIGRLAVCGTVNDVCMAGGSPKYLSLSFILEEGFPVRDLKEIVCSIADEAKKTGVIIATGDTKVVERGKGDGIYINTAGIGFLCAPGLGRDKIREGDAVILSGSAGCHGAAVMMARAGLIPTGTTLTDDSISDGACQNGALRSDCRPLHELSRAALKAGGAVFTGASADSANSARTFCTSAGTSADSAGTSADSAASSGAIRILRDPTRGGVATTLNEFVEGTSLTIELDEKSIPVDPAVEAACDLLGLDPLYCACEGRMLAVAAPEKAEAIVEALRKVSGGEQAAVIGTVTGRRPGQVILTTRLGGSRLLTKLSGQQLPRIC